MQNEDQRELTVKQVLERYPHAIPVFIELKTHCVGCQMNRFCTLQEVASAYHLPAGLLLEKLRASSPNQIRSNS